MGLFERLFSGIDDTTNIKRRNDLEGWKTISKSKYPERQVVIDYMSQYGIELVKSPNGIYYINNLNCDDFDGFMRLTNFRAKIGGVGHVAVQFDDGHTENHFMSLIEAYNALEILYQSIRATPGDDEF